MSRKVVLDVATIYPGKGGAGGGIWNYSKNLILYLDKHVELNDSVECICLVNKKFDLPVKNIKIKRTPFEPDNFVSRFIYVHIYLPLKVFFLNASLHKVYFETPFFVPFKMGVTIHDLMGQFYKTKKYNTISAGAKFKAFYFDLVTKIAIKKSKWICTPTNFIKQEIIQQYRVTPEKVTVTPLAVQKFKSLGTAIKVDKDSIDLYCIAAFHPHKGHLRLIEIFETLCESYNADTKLYFRGHIHDRIFFEKIEKKINESKFNDRIFVVNYETNSSIEEIYSKADWVILLSEYEGFGLPVIEAQANGIPVVCSSIPTFKEAAGNSVIYLENDLDKNSAAKLLSNVFSDSSQRKHFIEKGFENVQQYSWEKLADQMMTLYKTIGELN
jgi:glycosyltransferase involved in cell wall biosynthesis